MKRVYVVDTNVGVVANNEHQSASSTCVIACVEAIQLVRGSCLLAIDNGHRIVDEYRRKLSLSGRPGVGDAFMKWVWDNRFNPDYCEQVTIRARPNPRGEDFDEFPQDEALAGFDHADRKFVAVAIASPSKPCVMNAVDSDWHDFNEPLARNGVRVEEICPRPAETANRSRRETRRKRSGG